MPVSENVPPKNDRSDSRTNSKIFRTDLRFLAIGPELSCRLGDLLETAYADLAPRNFAERHLVDELVLAKWRGLRAATMEKAVYEHEQAESKPAATPTPHEDMYHLAMAHAPERHGVVLAALARLEIRYHRQFSSALRLLIALRRGTRPPVTAPTPETQPTVNTAKETIDEFPDHRNEQSL